MPHRTRPDGLHHPGFPPVRSRGQINPIPSIAPHDSRKNDTPTTREPEDRTIHAVRFGADGVGTSDKRGRRKDVAVPDNQPQRVTVIGDTYT